MPGRFRRAPLALAFIVLLLVAPDLSLGQTGGDGGCNKTAIERQLGTLLNLESSPLFVTRREDLEEVLLDLQFLAKSSTLQPALPIPVTSIRVYDGKREGYQVEKGRIVQAVVDVDDVPTWRFAYDCRSQSLLPLHGFSNDERGFNELMQLMAITVDSPSVALVVHSTFVRLTFLHPTDELRNELSLMRAIVDSGVSSGQRAISVWKKIPPRIKHQIAPPSVVVNADHFIVTFFAVVGRSITKRSLVIARDGRVRLAGVQHLYALPE